MKVEHFRVKVAFYLSQVPFHGVSAFCAFHYLMDSAIMARNDGHH